MKAQALNIDANISLKVWLPQGRAERLRGLIGIKIMPCGVGAWFQNCRWVHTFLMQFPIDCIGLHDDGSIAQIRIGVRPSQFIKFRDDISSVLELREGGASSLGLELGKRILLIPTISRTDLLLRR
jgi:uncharacterized membrane protein (UPF0127 family)